MADFLTKAEFDRWTASVDKRFDKLDAMANDVAVLKDRSNREDSQTKRISAIVSAAVAGGVSSAIAWLFHGGHA